MEKFNYDLIICGGGTAGVIAAVTAKGLGKKVLLIEKDSPGGIVNSRNYLFYKSFLYSALAHHKAMSFSDRGVESAISKVDLKKKSREIKKISMKFKNNISIDSLIKMGIDCVKGSFNFESSNKIKVKNKEYTSEFILISTGTAPVIPFPDASNMEYTTPENISQMHTLPKSIVVVGGGDTGVEIATAFRFYGVKTAIIEKSLRILPNKDEEISELIQSDMEEAGISVLTGYNAVDCKKSKNRVSVHCVYHDGHGKKVTAEKVFIAAGRKLNIENLKLEKAGIETDRDQKILLDKYLRTTTKNIYAAGDSTGDNMYNNAAEMEAVIAVNNMFSFNKKKPDYNSVPFSIESFNKYSGFGINSKFLEINKKKKYEIYKFPLKYSTKAEMQNDTNGLAKIVCTKSGKIISAHIYSSNSDLLIDQISILKKFGKNFSSLSFVNTIYPSDSEVLKRMSKRAYVNSVNRNIFLKIFSVLFSRR